MIEVWKDIEGFEGFFQISNYGRVKSLERQVTVRGGGVRMVKESIRNPIYNKANKGYSVQLSTKEKKKHCLIDQLVAKAFLGEPDNASAKLVHPNGDKMDSRASNLEYRIPTEAIKIKRYRKLTELDIVEIKRRRSNGEYCILIAEDYGVSIPTISKICRGLLWKDLPPPSITETNSQETQSDHTND